MYELSLSCGMLRYLVCFCLLSSAIAQVFRDGVCDWDSVPTVVNLNITGMLGEWHQIRRIGNPAETGQCSTITIELNTTSATPLTITNKEVHDSHVHDRAGYIVVTNETLGRFRIQYENSSYDTVVMLTDYTKFAVLYSCMPASVANSSAVLSWVYSRTTSLEEPGKTIVQNLTSSVQDLRNASWIEVQHTREACGISGGIATSLSRVVALLAVMVFGKSYIA